MRLVDILKRRPIRERGLSIHGKDEIIGSHYNGNYLGILGLLNKY